MDQPFIETLWKEVKMVTALDGNQPPPTINYLKDCYEYFNPQCYSKELCDPEAEQKRIAELKKNNKKEWKKCRKYAKSDALGVYYYPRRTISIYLDNINNYHWQWKLSPSNLSLSSKEEEAAFYNTVAHELLHHALFLKGVPLKNHHKIMKESGYMEKMIDLISAHFNLPLNGLQKEISLQSLERGIQLDEDNNNEAMDSPLIMKCGAGNNAINKLERHDGYRGAFLFRFIFQ